jgi:hypothetical protein
MAGTKPEYGFHVPIKHELIQSIQSGLRHRQSRRVLRRFAGQGGGGAGGRRPIRNGSAAFLGNGLPSSRATALREAINNQPQLNMNTSYRITSTTLREYRMEYPWTSPFPTLTQSRMLRVLLDRQRQKAFARRRRLAQWRNAVTAIRYAFAHPWRVLNGEYPVSHS